MSTKMLPLFGVKMCERVCNVTMNHNIWLISARVIIRVIWVMNNESEEWVIMTHFFVFVLKSILYSDHVIFYFSLMNHLIILAFHWLTNQIPLVFFCVGSDHIQVFSILGHSIQTFLPKQLVDVPLLLDMLGMSHTRWMVLHLEWNRHHLYLWVSLI